MTAMISDSNNIIIIIVVIALVILISFCYRYDQRMAIFSGVGFKVYIRCSRIRAGDVFWLILQTTKP